MLAHDPNITLSEWLWASGAAGLALILGIGLALLISRLWPLR